MRKPLWCPDPGLCKCALYHPSDVEDKPGESSYCVGFLRRPVCFTYDGIEHENDRRLCVKTPMKGIVKFDLNWADIAILKNMIYKLTNR